MFDNVKVTASTDSPKIEIYRSKNKKDTLILLEDITYDITIDGITKIIVVPAGTSSDGASIPYFAQSILRMQRIDPRTIVGALLHDYVFRNAFVNLSFTNANKCLYKLCKCADWKKKSIYYSVKWFGKSNYKPR